VFGFQWSGVHCSNNIDTVQRTRTRANWCWWPSNGEIMFCGYVSYSFKAKRFAYRGRINRHCFRQHGGYTRRLGRRHEADLMEEIACKYFSVSAHVKFFC
jgi:hypothetical protein